jgi:serine/threonine-protein kinase
MATVFLAVVRGPAGFNKMIVVKCLRPSLAAEREFLEMFLAEARLAARINHPNVVQTNEVGFDGQYYFISMEYIDGPTLETIVRKTGGTFPVALHLQVIIQTLAGLHHAHELKDFDGKPLNVVHRDVSPHNIMVSYDGHVKLLDFGIAKAADSGGNTRTGILKGKCAYMAAEQFGGHDVDRRADIFAAGVCLWQAITGSRLWKGLSDAEIFSRISRGEIPSPKTVQPNLPDELVHICMRALAPAAADRFSTAAEFATALEDFVARNPGYGASNRDLARFVSETFTAERAAMKEKVDEQLRLAASGATLVSFQSDLASGVMPTTAPMVLPQKRRSGMWVVPVLLLALAVAAGAFVLNTQRKKAVAARESNPSAAQARISIHVTPDTAKVFFDDAPLEGNPATASLARDGLSHRVRAEAPGYARKTQLVVLDNSNVTLDIDLEKEDQADEVDPFGNKLTALTFKSVPPTARLYLDNVLLPTNPSTAKYPRDGRAHQLKADAPGFVAKTVTVNFDAAQASSTITLDRDPKWTPPPIPKAGHRAAAPAAKETPAAEAPAPAAQPKPAAAPAAAPGQKPKSLDREDPWK